MRTSPQLLFSANWCVAGEASAAHALAAGLCRVVSLSRRRLLGGLECLHQDLLHPVRGLLIPPVPQVIAVLHMPWSPGAVPSKAITAPRFCCRIMSMTWIRQIMKLCKPPAALQGGVGTGEREREKRGRRRGTEERLLGAILVRLAVGRCRAQKVTLW